MVGTTRSSAARVSGRRVVSIYFPYWSTDLLRRRMMQPQAKGTPQGVPRDKRMGLPPVMLLSAQRAGREEIAAACARGRSMGIVPGMDVANARALVQGALIKAAYRPERDAQALRALAGWCNRFSPVVGVEPPDGLVLDISGTQRLYKGEDVVLRMLHRAITRLGLTARIAIASTVACAWAVARFGDERRVNVPPGREREWLAPLPIAALRASARVTDALMELGVVCVGELLTLPRSSIPSRFGEELLLTLDCALGQGVEIIEPVRPQPPLRAEQMFEGPTTQWESLECCLRGLVPLLTAALHRQGRGVRRLEVFLHRTNRQPPVCMSMALCRPSRDERHLWSMLRPHLEKADMGEGVEGITLIASRTGVIRHEQAMVCQAGKGLTPTQFEQSLGMLSDTLMSRLGPESVRRMVPVESHVPEQSWKTVSVMEETGVMEHVRAQMRIHESPRPSLLFERPEPVEVVSLCPDGPVHRLHWKGAWWRVDSCIGPERISGRWWLASPEHPQSTREYYRVRAIPPDAAAARWLWIYHEQPRDGWWVHGEWA